MTHFRAKVGMGKPFATPILGGGGMARRAGTGGLIGAVVVVVSGVAWSLNQGLQFLVGLPSEFWGTVAVITVGVGLVVVGNRVLRAVQQNRARRAAGQKAAAAIKQHLPSLVRRREQLVRQDAYGKPRLENWEKR